MESVLPISFALEEVSTTCGSGWSVYGFKDEVVLLVCRDWVEEVVVDRQREVEQAPVRIDSDGFEQQREVLHKAQHGCGVETLLAVLEGQVQLRTGGD